MKISLLLALLFTQRDLADWVLWATSLALAIVGTVGVVVAWRTLGSMKFQSTAMVAAQRAYLSLAARLAPADTLFDPAAPRMVVRLINVGKTPAYDLCYESWIEILQPEFEDFTSRAVHFKDDATYCLHSDSDLTVNIPFQRRLDPAELADIKSDTRCVFIRVRATYTDSLRREHFADFAYRILHDGFRAVPKYNDASR